MGNREERGGQWVSRTREDSTPLAGNATRTGEEQSTYGFSRFRAFASADAAGTLNVQQSPDRVTWYTTVTQPVAAGATTGTVVESLVTLPWVRAQYVNGAGAQTNFEFDTALVGI